MKLNVLRNEYGFHDIKSISNLQGGFNEQETWLVELEPENKYVLKIIEYEYSMCQLEIILQFQNYLCLNLNYPCPEIVLTTSLKLFVQTEDKCIVFLQTYINGQSPELSDLNEFYVREMGRLLGQWHLASRQFMNSLLLLSNFTRQELTDQWWTEKFNRLVSCQHLKTIDIEYLRSILVQCKQKIECQDDTWERGLIHNDFQTSNTIYILQERKIFIIDFGEVTFAPFIMDLAMTLFLFLTNGVDDDKRLKLFLDSYQQFIQLNHQDIKLIDTFVRLKLTTNFIEDCANIKSDEEYQQSPWLQICNTTIHQLKGDLFESLLSQ